MTCQMTHTPPMPFAQCETHDEVFPLGAVCPEHRSELTQRALLARATGDAEMERHALDMLALDERARA